MKLPLCLAFLSTTVFLLDTEAFAPVTAPPLRVASASPFAKRQSSSSSTTTMSVALGNYVPEAISLFKNMITPASILAGSLVPITFAANLPIRTANAKDNTPLSIRLRQCYNMAAVLGLLSNLIAVMWGVISVNQLTETAAAPAASVFHLLRRDYDLAWAGINAHFLFGLLSFAACIACRAFLQVGGGALGQSLAGLAGGGLLMMVSIVNRAVASGAGDGVHRYGTNVVSLFGRYAQLFCLRAVQPKDIGILGVSAVVVSVGSLLVGLRAIIRPEVE
jgi:hypothetical protein